MRRRPERNSFDLSASHQIFVWPRRPFVGGFSLPELLVVVGIIALLVAVLAPPLQLARRHALATRCGTQLQQIGVALEGSLVEHKYYPLWDDGGSPVRYTWIDLLVQRRLLGDVSAGYCPQDLRPEPLNSARARQMQIYYPGEQKIAGIDYSYGIGVPLAAGGWSWRPEFSPPGDPRPRQFINHDRNTSSRLLAADANWSAIYNLSGDAIVTNDWSAPTQFDNTMAWRHEGPSANVLFQDGHVGRVAYRVGHDTPINTAATFVWFPGEPLHVGPGDKHLDNYYPLAPPMAMIASEPVGALPREVVPAYYTRNKLWTQIEHK